MLIAGIAMLGMLIVATVLLLDKNETADNMEQLNELGTLAPMLSNVVHEMQKERGMSAAFIGSKGKNFATELPQQRKLTDAKRTILKEALADFDAEEFGNNLVSKIESSLSALQQFDAERSGVSNLNSSVSQMATYYSGTIDKLLLVIEEMVNLSADANATRAIAAYTNFLRGKEAAGIERAMGGGGFGKGEFSLEAYLRFVNLIGHQEVLFTNLGSMLRRIKPVFTTKQSKVLL